MFIERGSESLNRTIFPRLTNLVLRVAIMGRLPDPSGCFVDVCESLTDRGLERGAIIEVVVTGTGDCPVKD